MKKILIIFIIILIAVSAWAKMGMDMSLNLGSGGVTVGPPSECPSGYDALTGSDSNVIHDSLGEPICCPQ